MSERPNIGDVRWSYWILPRAVNGNDINGGNHYANADSAEDARATAERMIGGDGVYLGYTLGSVACDGGEVEFTGSGWAPLKGGRTDSFVVSRAEVGAEPVFLRRDETRCYDSTTMDYFETVHAMKTDGSCQCGDPTRNTRS
jgi:hypothetical protein